MRLAADEVDKDVGDLVILLLHVDAGERIGEVLAIRRRLGLGVRGLVRDGVDGCAADALAADRVGMDRDEQVGLVLAGDSHPLVERQELVALARHVDVILAGLLQLLS